MAVVASAALAYGICPTGGIHILFTVPDGQTVIVKSVGLTQYGTGPSLAELIVSGSSWTPVILSAPLLEPRKPLYEPLWVVLAEPGAGIYLSAAVEATYYWISGTVLSGNSPYVPPPGPSLFSVPEVKPAFR